MCPYMPPPPSLTGETRAAKFETNEHSNSTPCPLACQPALCSTWRCPVPLDAAIDAALISIVQAGHKAVPE